MGKIQDTYELLLEAKNEGATEEVRKLQKELRELEHGEKKAAMEMEKFLKEVGNAEGPVDILAAGLDKLKDTLKLGIVGGLAANAIQSIVVKTDELDKSIQAVSDSFREFEKQSYVSDTVKTVSELKQEMKEAEKQAKALDDQAAQFSDPDTFSMLNLRRKASLFNPFDRGSGEDSEIGMQNRAAWEREREAKFARDRQDAIGAEIAFRKKQAERGDQISLGAARDIPSDLSAVSNASVREDIARKDLTRAKDSGNYDSGEIERRRLALAIAERQTRELAAQYELTDKLLKLSGDGKGIEQSMLDVKLSVLSATEKGYELAKLNVKAAEAQLKYAQAIGAEAGERARMKRDEAVEAVRQMDETLNKGRTIKATRDRIAAQEREERETKKFRDKRMADRGVIPTKRDFDGKVIEGIDPVTGEKKDTKEDEFAKFFHGQRKAMEAQTADQAKALVKVVKTRKEKEREAEAKKKAEANDPVKTLDQINNSVKELKAEIGKLVCNR